MQATLVHSRPPFAHAKHARNARAPPMRRRAARGGAAVTHFRGKADFKVTRVTPSGRSRSSVIPTCSFFILFFYNPHPPRLFHPNAEPPQATRITMKHIGKSISSLYWNLKSAVWPQLICCPKGELALSHIQSLLINKEGLNCVSLGEWGHCCAICTT